MLWNSEQWKEQFELLSVQRCVMQKEEAKFLRFPQSTFSHSPFVS